jgi:hypothetical protein
MKKNLGSADKLIRLFIAIVLMILYYFEIITGTVGIVALVFALVFTVTSMIGYSLIYALFGLNTNKKEDIEDAGL